MTRVDAQSAGASALPPNRYRLPGIEREGIAQLSLLETALWPLQGGPREGGTFDTSYKFKAGEQSRPARVSVYAPLGLYAIDEYVLWGLLALSLARKEQGPVLMATPYWIIQQLGMSIGGYQYEQLRGSLERLALSAYQNTGFYNPLSQQHERVTLHFFSTFLPTKGRGGDVDAERAWRIEWSPQFFKLCQATGGTLLFDLDLYRELTPAARRLYLKLKDRFWRSKRVFMNVDDLTVNGLGFSANRPLKKRKFDLTSCIRELLRQGVIELGRGQTDPADLFLRRGKGLYVVQFFEGPYFRTLNTERARSPQNRRADDPLWTPLRNLGVDEAAIRRLFRQHSRALIQRWVRITDAAVHEHPSGFAGFKVSPAAFLIDGIQNERMPPDWIYAHEKQRERDKWERERQAQSASEAELKTRYNSERQAARDGYLTTIEGRRTMAEYETAFRQFYQAVEPERWEQAAREAALAKVEREHVRFPDFGVWLLEGRSPAGE
jgi:hypothetical protein